MKPSLKSLKTLRALPALGLGGGKPYVDLTPPPEAADLPAGAPDPRCVVRASRIGVPLMHSLYDVRTHGRANVPATGAVILAGNHTGFLDGPLIVGVSPRPVNFLVKQELFKGALGRFLLWIGQIPVDRENPDRAAITASLGVLRAGAVLGVFPEGTRGEGSFEAVHNGLAYFTLSTGAPVVPVACLGTNINGKTIGAMPRFRSRVDLVYGTPMTLAELSEGTEGLGRKQKIAAISETLRVRLAAHVEHAQQLLDRNN